MLTISELAAYAGVTVRAVRHYHQRGLLPEPPRDHSGYRSYDGAAVIELIKIRTLTEAGVPLARVQELLAAAPAEFATAIAEIDARLVAEIEQREQHRVRLARLAAGDHVALPDEVVDFLERLRALGVDERIVRVERDGWIPLAAHDPDRVPELIARKREQLGDQRLVDFYRTMSAALDRNPKDPLLIELVDRMVAYLAQLSDELGDDYVGGGIERSLADLLDSVALESAPLAGRLVELMAAHGWRGWTKLERVRVESE